MGALAVRHLDVPLPGNDLTQGGETASSPRRNLRTVPLTRPNTGLHANVMKLLAGVNAFIIAVFWLTFQGDPEALFMVAIGGAFLIAYLGIPWAMGRVGGLGLDNRKPFSEFLSEPFETGTGVISGWEATLQVLLVPAAIACAVVGMGFIITMNR